MPDPGDDALAAGLPILDPETDLVRDGATEINITRDIIANRTSAVTPIEKGGTGATTATGARTALGLPAGATAVANLGLTATLIPTTGSNTQADIDYLNSIKYPKSGGIITGNVGITGSIDRVLGNIITDGNVFVPNSSAAASGWTAAYINSDGRLCRGASSLRYKKYVSEVQPSAFGNIFPPLNRFQMRGGDGRWTYGHIAETLAENPDTEPFVMYDAEGRPDSVDYVPLLLAKVEQLNARIAALEGAQ